MLIGIMSGYTKKRGLKQMGKLSNEQLELINLILEQGFIYSTFISIRIYKFGVIITTPYEDFELSSYKITWGLKKGGGYKYHA